MSRAAPRSWVVSITPFREDGTLDEDAFRRHLLRMAAAGQSIYVGSTNVGEGFGLDELEHSRLLAIAKETLAGKTPLRHGGREARGIAEAISTVRLAEAAGVDAVHIFQLDCGHASSRPSVSELDAYYSAILAAADMPVVLSNYPSMGYSVPVELLESLLDRFPAIVAIRDAGGDLRYLDQLVQRLGDRVEIYVAGARNLATALLLGVGTMTVEANVAPGLVGDLLRHAGSGDQRGLREAYARFITLHLALNATGAAPAAAIKDILSRYQLCRNVLRAPRSAAGAMQQKHIASLGHAVLAELETVEP